MNSSSPQHDRSFRNWLPSSSLNTLRQEVSDLVDSFFGEAAPPWRGDSVPRIDLIETPDSLEIQADLPGWKTDEISVDLTDNHLILSGHRTLDSSSQSDDRRFLRTERRVSNFTRSILLPGSVDESAVEALLRDGVLTVRLLKRDDGRRRHVPVRGPDTSAPEPPPANNPS